MRRFVAVHHETGELLCSGPVLDDIRDERDFWYPGQQDHISIFTRWTFRLFSWHITIEREVKE